MAAYRRVYDSHHPQADCQEPGSAPEPYARYSSMGYLYLYTWLCVCEQRSYHGVTHSWPACLHTSATHRHRGFAATTAPTSTSSSGCCDSRRRLFPTPPHTQASTLTMAGRPLGGSRWVRGRRRRCPRGAESTWKRADMTCQPPLTSTPPHAPVCTLTMSGRPLGGSRWVRGRRRRGTGRTWRRRDVRLCAVM